MESKMASSKKSKTTSKKATTSALVPIPGTISLEGPLPIKGTIEGNVKAVRQNWEYYVYDITQGTTAAQIQARINQLGAAGWEIVCPLFPPGLASFPVIFKRPS